MPTKDITIMVDAKTATYLDRSRANLGCPPSSEYSEIITTLLDTHPVDWSME